MTGVKERLSWLIVGGKRQEAGGEESGWLGKEGGRALGPSLGRQNTDRPPEVSTRGAYATFCVSDEISDMLGAMPKSLPHIIYQTAQLTFN